MNFWQQLLSATGMGTAFPWAVLVFIVVALILLFSKPEERMRIRTALLLFALSLVASLSAAALLTYGSPPAGPSFALPPRARRILLWVSHRNRAPRFLILALLPTPA